MPNLLQTLLDRATTPLLPQSVIQGTQDTLTQPSLTQSPTMARIKGFGAGALQGVRDLTSPAMLAGSLMDDVPGALLASRFLGAGSKAAEAAPAIAEGMSALKPTLTSFGKLAAPALTRGAKVAETLGEMSPEFTPLGGEGMFNATRGAGTPVPGSDDSLYQLAMQRFMGK